DVDLVVAVDVEERTEAPAPGRAAGRPRAVVRMASAVEADWLLELFTDAIRDTTEAVWNPAAERVDVVRRLAYEGLVLEEARGGVPVVLHLLAPNQRAVQVTTDLAGFWARHYPAIAKELRRKYPKHAWPDDPLTARPPEPRRR